VNRSAPLPPGSVLGVLGAGQLGRMFAAAAVRMGYRVHLYAPDGASSPAAAHAERTVTGAWQDEDALAGFAAACHAVTLEFENVPAAALDLVSRQVPVRPGRNALYFSQNRGREKGFLERLGVPLAPWWLVDTEAKAWQAAERLAVPALLKTAGFGYDGKGQATVLEPGDVAAAWTAIGGGPAVLEERLELAFECSVVMARDQVGGTVCYPPIRNDHRGGILDLSTFPSGLEPGLTAQALRIARRIAAGLELVGVACVEFFVTGDRRLLVNEVAPRPHNSGHLTIEAAATSQFEQQVRAVAGLPLGDVFMRSAAAMANLLGEVWADGEPDWAAALSEAGVALHLYGKTDANGKTEAREGRKMGHLTVLDQTADGAADKVLRARAALRR